MGRVLVGGRPGWGHNVLSVLATQPPDTGSLRAGMS